MTSEDRESTASHGRWSVLGPQPIGEPWTTAGTSGHRTSTEAVGRSPYSPLASDGGSGRRGVRVSHAAAASPAGSCPRGGGHRGRASPSGRGGANGATACEGHPRWPCHKRAIHSGPEQSRADNHGQPRSSLDLHHSLPSQITAAPELALGAGGRRRLRSGRTHFGVEPARRTGARCFGVVSVAQEAAMGCRGVLFADAR
jgi:hypothetical protein